MAASEAGRGEGGDRGEDFIGAGFESFVFLMESLGSAARVSYFHRLKRGEGCVICSLLIESKTVSNDPILTIPTKAAKIFAFL